MWCILITGWGCTCIRTVGCQQECNSRAPSRPSTLLVNELWEIPVSKRGSGAPRCCPLTAPWQQGTNDNLVLLSFPWRGNLWNLPSQVFRSLECIGTVHAHTHFPSSCYICSLWWSLIISICFSPTARHETSAKAWVSSTFWFPDGYHAFGNYYPRYAW